MFVRMNELFCSRKRTRSRFRPFETIQGSLQGIPGWVFELAVLVAATLALRYWLSRRDRRIVAPAYVQELPPLGREAARRPSGESPAEPLESAATETAPAERDDLKRISGIGPRVAILLGEVGITTFRQLAESNVEDLRQILRQAGLPMMDPGSWPEQARLAAVGDWSDLTALQAGLRGVRRAET